MASDGGVLAKNPSDILIYACDYGFQPEILAAVSPEVLASATLSQVSGPDNALVFTAPVISGNQARTQLSGGTLNGTYKLNFSGTYQSGRIRNLSVEVLVTI